MKELSDQKRRIEIAHAASLSQAETRYRELEMQSQSQNASLTALEQHVRLMTAIGAVCICAAVGFFGALHALRARPYMDPSSSPLQVSSKEGSDGTKKG